MTGVILGAAAFHIPMVLDGFISGAAALLAQRLCPHVHDVLFASPSVYGNRPWSDARSPEAAAGFDLEMRLGEGTGACILMGLIGAAAKILGEMATFESAGVEKTAVSFFLRSAAVFDSLPLAQADGVCQCRRGTIRDFFSRDRFAFRLDPGAGKFLLEPFASAGLLSVILVTLLAFMTRGLHLDGVGDTFDGLGAGGDRDRILSVMDDSHTGVFGLVAIVLVLLLKIHALESMDVDRWRALLVAPSSGVGRWCYWLIAPRQPKRDWVRI